jgi:hypothetical protein
MRKGDKIFYLAMLLVGSLMITPALGSMYQADHPMKITSKNPELITVDFVDCTSTIPVKKQIAMPKKEWISMNNELHAIASSGISMKETFAAQIGVFQNHQLLLKDVNIDSLFNKINQRTNMGKIRSIQNKIHSSPINNSLFGVLSAITCTIDNGTNAVFGLNTFINTIGFDIISIHKGHAAEGIQLNGVTSNSVPPGEYFGFMFGFFGYWYGTKASTLVYSDVTLAGLIIITFWLQIQSS